MWPVSNLVNLLLHREKTYHPSGGVILNEQVAIVADIKAVCLKTDKQAIMSNAETICNGQLLGLLSF